MGAGKTSLLNHLLGNNQGLKIGVIVNDFGEINIDAMLVSAQTDTALQLSNGCICCSLEGESLDDAIGQLAHAGSRLDYIVIEASGLAEPRELATMLRLLKNNYAYFDSLVSVVDAANFEKNNQASKNVLTDLAIADLIVLNKTDLVTEAQLQDIEQGIQLAAPKTRLLTTTHGQVDFRLLLGTSEKGNDQLNLHQHDHHDHLHDKFTQISFSSKNPLDPQKFQSWAENLDAKIFRAKGIMHFGSKGLNQKFIFQAVGARFSLKLDEWAFDQSPQTDLVVIGLGLDKAQVEQELNQLIDATPDDVSADTLMDILAYK